MLKATTVNNEIGLESHPHSLNVNEDGYVLLPELPDTNDGYILYAPLKGFEEQGPWYYKRFISRREAKRARRTVVGLSEDRDLCPQMSPQEPMLLTFPEPDPQQLYWMLGGYVNGKHIPIGIFPCH